MKQKLGAMCWMFTIFYFAAQPVVAGAWNPPYSYSANTISDLGYATCGPVDESWRAGAFVCSPRHALMNLTFVLVGLFTCAGAMLVRKWWPHSRTTMAGIVLLVLSGIGGVVVGLAPGDLYFGPHIVGAGLQFPAALAPLLFGLVTPAERRWEKLTSIVLGLAGIAGTLLFLTGTFDLFGVGTTERLAFDPLTIWLVILGVIVLTAGRSARTIAVQE